MRIRGGTFAERKAARTKRTAQRRADYYEQKMRTATDPHDQIRIACDYLRAVAHDLPRDQARALIQEVAAVVERWNTK